MHRVPDRQRGDREDRDGHQVLHGPCGLHGEGREAHRHRLRELPQHLRGGGAAADPQALRQGVPGQGVLGRRDGTRHGVPPGHRGARDAGHPGRGGCSAQEGLRGHRLPAHQDRHRPLRACVRGPDIAGAHRQPPGRGLDVDVPQEQHRQVQPLLPRGAQGDSRGQGGGGAASGQDNRGRAGPHRRARGGVRRRQGRHRAPRQGCQHRRGGLRGRGDHRARQGRQGDDIQLGVRGEAEVPGHQQDAGAPRGGPRHEAEPFHTVGVRREDVRRGLRGVRCPGQEAHPVLDLPAGPGQDRGGEGRSLHGQQRQGGHGRAAGHPVQGARREDGGDRGGEAQGGRR